MDPAFAVGEALEKVGVIVLGAATAAALTAKAPTRRIVATAATLVLMAVILVGHIWSTAQFRSISGNAPAFATLVVVGIVVVAGLGLVFSRRPEAFILLAVCALPFRVPIQAAGATANLLVPLYVVIAGGAVAYMWNQATASKSSIEAARAQQDRLSLIEAALALFILLYAVQSLYSNDFQTALEQVVFFYVPFALLFKLLAEACWTRKLVTLCLAALVVLALAFSAVGFWEYGHRELLWNPKVISANQFESYFRVNSVFWDPNIFGRFLMIVMLGLTGVMLWAERPRVVLGAALALSILWAGLVLTLSQSSLGALLVGLAVLAALRWDARRVAAISALGATLGAVFLFTFQDTLKVHLGSSAGLNRATSGRVNLIEGGADLMRERPLWGHGSGSFARSYRREKKGNQQQAVSASHTTPLTVAAEQGLLGLAAYALVLVAAVRVLVGRSSAGDNTVARAARAALLAAFVALVAHTLVYAAFLEDPFTWVILAAGVGILPHAGFAAARTPASTGAARPAPAAA